MIGSVAFQKNAPEGPAVPCFFGNARVLTPSGYCRMDRLRVGDLVSTPGGGSVPIVRVSVTQCEAGRATNPYVIPEGLFGATRRTLISPRHRVATASGMIEARRLGLEQEVREGTLTYYNLELPGWANMIVAGVEVESLAPRRSVVLTEVEFCKMLLIRGRTMSYADLAAFARRQCRRLHDGTIRVYYNVAGAAVKTA
jgi:hypothetical protein